MTSKLGAESARHIQSFWDSSISQLNRNSMNSVFPEQIKSAASPWSGTAFDPGNFGILNSAPPDMYRNFQLALNTGVLTSEWMKLFNFPTHGWNDNPGFQNGFPFTPNVSDFGKMMPFNSVPPLFWRTVPNKNYWTLRS